MSIKDLAEKIKGLPAIFQSGEEELNKYYTAAIIVLVGFASFGLGRLSVIESSREPVTIDGGGATESAVPPDGGTAPRNSNQGAAAANAFNTAAPSASGQLVASKNGTKYYFPWCAGAQKIADANKIWFNSDTDARAKGFTPAANCKGLK